MGLRLDAGLMKIPTGRSEPLIRALCAHVTLRSDEVLFFWGAVGSAGGGGIKKTGSSNERVSQVGKVQRKIFIAHVN
jgi:hypothetical protein